MAKIYVKHVIEILLSLFEVIAREHVSTQDTLPRMHMNTQDKLVRENIRHAI